MKHLMKKMKQRVIWLTETIALIGIKTDKAIAKKLGIKESSVTRKRYEKRIKRSPDQLKKQPRQKRPWTDDEIEMLGTMPDRYVANRIGVSRTAVYEKRHELNIKARLWQ